jgi:two-component system, sensor histidine kinase
MHDQTITQDERKAIEAEQVKAYFHDANDLNWAGLLVFCILVYTVHEDVPLWTWAPAVAFLFLNTLFRSFLILQYRRNPESRSSGYWMNSQAFSAGLSGACWGIAAMLMLAYLPVTFQFFVLTVATVVAATATSEGFSLVLPPRFFTLASVCPPAIWLLTVGDRLHSVISLMLLLFIPVMLLIGSKKNHVFVEAQRLRFKNERLVNELSRQQELLEAASNAKSRFLAAASHDLRQPLAALMIFLEQLEFERQLSPSGKNILEHAQLATGSLCTLLDGLLDISRLDGHAIKPKIKAFAVQSIFDDLEDEFLAQARQKGIRLKFSPCSCIIESDILLLQQILRNLISNALRYTPAGRILVGCRRRQGKLSIEVHDTGIGIPENQFPKIFDEFYQIDTPECELQQGLGLGLSIVERAARLLGHSVSLSSTLGRGSCFAVAVPLLQAGSFEVQSDSALPHYTPDIAGRLVAIIENEGGIRTGMQSLLQSWGCRVVVADSAASMVELLDNFGETVELVISDFGLRGSSNGVEAIAAIRQRWGDKLPALLFTGNIGKETFALARNAGLTVLYKPAKPEALREAMIAALGY